VAADEDSGTIDPEKSLAKLGSIAYVAGIAPSKIQLYEVMEDRSWVKIAHNKSTLAL
jgi:hypothetical protein